MVGLICLKIGAARMTTWATGQYRIDNCPDLSLTFTKEPIVEKWDLDQKGARLSFIARGPGYFAIDQHGLHFLNNKVYIHDM